MIQSFQEQSTVSSRSFEDCIFKKVKITADITFQPNQTGVVCVDMLHTRIFDSKVYIDLEIQANNDKSLRGDKFSYRDMRKVYTIVIFENSTGNFHRMPKTYIHRGRVAFDTGLEMDFLQEYRLVALDVFRQIPYAVNRNEQTAWLSLLVTETVEEAERLMTEYPWLKEIYEEIAMLRQKPEEVLHMFSEALRIMDRNTVRYMVEEQQKELEEKQKKIDEQQEQLLEKDQEIRMLKEQLAKANPKE